jgi:predicted ATPase
MSFQIGDMIGDYQVIELLGAGGMGKVYKVRNLISDRVEAAKILLPDFRNEPELADRFMREIKVQASLNHPFIAALHTALRIDNQLVMMMELVEGITLDARMGQSPLGIDEGLGYIRQVLDALSYAHARGVVHRDIKPANIMITPVGTVKLMDFGIARTIRRDRLTRPGMAVGSAAYMAPEQVRGEEPDPRSDLYSAGVVLYEIAAGERPFQGENDYEIMTAQLKQAPRSPREMNPSVAPALSEMILKSLAKNPAERFQSAKEFRACLQELEPGPLKPSDHPPITARVAALPPDRRFVGRKDELARLMAGYKSAASGTGRFLCISGDPGMGKTALVGFFLAQLAADHAPFALAHGHCSERLSEAEPYRSVFEAFETLLSGAEGTRLRPLFKEVAPTWFKRLWPGEGGEDTAPASQERMIREATAFFVRSARAVPLILFLDDLQWADVSTLDLLHDLTSHLDGTSILVVGTYRPHEFATRKDAFHQTKLQLQSRGSFREIPLDYLTAEDCQSYLDREFRGARFSEEFSSMVRSKTAGNPLFLVELVRFLRDRKFIAEEGDGWTLTRPASELRDDAPESVRAMIQAKLDQLSESERRLLLAASVQGVDFDSAVVAKALSLDPAEVEDSLEAVQRTRGMVESAGEVELPDGTLTVCYRFVQDPDHHALYGSLKPSRRASLSAALAEAVVEFHGRQLKPVAARVALLFETARKFGPAVEYFQLGADSAAQVGASHEAIKLASRGLDLLQKLPESAERNRQELTLRMTLGGPLTLARFGSPEVRENYVRAWQLCSDLDDKGRLAPVLWGLWLSHLAEAQLKDARELASKILQMAEQDPDPIRLVAAHWAMGTTLGNLGEIVQARSHFERGIELYNPQQHDYYASVYGFDPGVACRVELGGRFLWLLGYPDLALRMIQEARELAQRMAHPPSVTFALAFEALLHQLRGDTAACFEYASEVLGDPHSPSNLRAWATLCQGWVLVERGETDRGVEQIQASLAAHEAIGSPMGRPHFLALLAGALGQAGKALEGLAALGKAFDMMKSTGQRYYEAELSRICGELLIRNSENDAAEFYLQESLGVARKQGARSLELRASVSLARLWRSQGKLKEAGALVGAIYGAFDEGFECRDLVQAKALIGELGAGAG